MMRMIVMIGGLGGWMDGGWMMADGWLVMGHAGWVMDDGEWMGWRDEEGRWRRDEEDG